MAFDGFFLKKIIQELKPEILNSRINKVNNISNNEFIFTLRKFKNFKLFISANPTNSRFHITNKKYENEKTPSNFSIVLRKYLLNGTITNIEQINNDRILKLTIKNHDELKYEKYYKLIIETMGKHSNIILCDENEIIIDSLKNFYDITFKRATISNQKYTLPPTEEKENIFKTLNKNTIYKEKNLIKNYYGFSKLLANYLENKDIYSFFLNFEDYYKPTLLKINNKFDFYFFDIVNNKENIYFSNLSELLDFYYEQNSNNTQSNKYKKEIEIVINNRLKRLNNKIKLLNKSLINNNDNEMNKIKGELLISNIYNFKKNTPKTVTLNNFYSENYEEISINLDENKSIEQNAQIFFKTYKKNKRSIINIEKQIEIANEEINYFNNIKYQLEIADISDLEEIKEELIKLNYIIRKQNKKPSINKKNSILSITFNDIKILIGKNNIQNEMITHKLAKKKYTWLHAKNIPGSHIVICSEKVNDEILNIGLMLAGYFSKLKNENFVEVDYTLIKYVKKIPNSKPGMVTYTNQKTIKTKIDTKLIFELIKTK